MRRLGGCIFRAKRWTQAGIGARDPAAVLGSAAIDAATRPLIEEAQRRFRLAREIMDGLSARERARAAIDGDGLSGDFGPARRKRGFAPPRAPVRAPLPRAPARRAPLRVFLMARPVVHIIGAGLAGTRRGGEARSEAPCDIVVHEATRQAGGRCRSFFDETMDATIDNGNHLLLSGNDAALGYLDAIGARQELRAARTLRNRLRRYGERRALDAAAERRTSAVVGAVRRAPRPAHAPTGLSVDHPAAAGAAGKAAIADVIPCSGALYQRLWGPFFLATLNSEPRGARPRSRRRSCARRWRAAGALAIRWWRPTACRAPSSIPALKLLRRAGAQVRFERRLRALDFSGDRLAALEFEHDSVALGAPDIVVLATPAACRRDAGARRRDAARPSTRFLNAHFSVAPPARTPPILGVVNATTQWLFAYPDRLSVTVSDANRLMDDAARTIGRRPLARGRGADRPVRRPARLAHRQGAPRHLRGFAGGKRAAPDEPDAVGQSAARRRLCADRLAGDDRRRDPLRPDGGAIGA